jgi:hypothetical protein
MDIVLLIYRPMEPLGVQGLRVQPLDNGGAMEARAFGRAHRFAGLAVARTDAEGTRCARVHVVHDILTGRPEPV